MRNFEKETILYTLCKQSIFCLSQVPICSGVVALVALCGIIAIVFAVSLGKDIINTVEFHCLPFRKQMLLYMCFTATTSVEISRFPGWGYAKYSHDILNTISARFIRTLTL